MDAPPKAARPSPASAPVVTPRPGVNGPAANGAGPTTGSAAAAKPWRGRVPRAWLVGGSAAAVVAAGLLVWRPWRSAGPPRLNEPPPTLAAFVDTPAFAKLPFDRQLTYYKSIDKSEDALVESYRKGELTEGQYRQSLQAAYLGRHLDRMQDYFKRPVGRSRDAYLDKLLDKKEAEKHGKPVKKKDGKKEVPKPDARDAADVKDIKRDEATEAETVARWPAEVQQQWKQYHRALAERREQRKEQERLAKEAANPASKPATQPGKR